MAKIGIFMADGCEEIEGLTVLDLLRRVGIEVCTISINGTTQITGSHKLTFFTDDRKETIDFSSLDGIVLPGGMPGTVNLGADSTVNKVITEFAAAGKLVCAICAAPSVLGKAGLLIGKKYTCYPSFEEDAFCGTYLLDRVVVDGNLITSRGLGTAIDFSAAIIEYLADAKTAKDVLESVMYL